MKKNIPEWLKTTLVLIAFLSVVVVWGSTTAITFIEYNTVVAIISVVSYFAVFVGIFGIEMYTNKYKFKYLILGKKYKEKVQKFMVELNKFNKKERKAYIKSMKAEYRRTGNVYFSVYYLFETPNKVWSDDNRSFVYYNALDWQKAEYLIYLLNFYCETGGGFNRFFESVAEEPFTFDEIEKIVKSSDLFSKELKKLVLRPKHKKVFECFQNEDNLTDEDWNFLEDFENNESNDLFDFHEEIYGTIEKLSINCYLELKKTYALPENVKKVFISKDKTKRICVYLDKNLNAYKVLKEEFVFYETEYSLMNSMGGWVSHEESSLFETEKQALNDIKSQIKDYEELK